MTPEQKDAQARNRYFAITLTRIIGALCVAFGIMIVWGRFADIPAAVGYALVIIGLLDIIVLRRILVRRWRTPPEA